jgi:Ferritin-like domain
MTEHQSHFGGQQLSRKELARLLNEDLSREYQAVISYVVYSQVLKGAEFMSIADQLERHAEQELRHALVISRQIDYLGEIPSPQKRSAPRKTRGRCFASISRMRMKPSEIIASGFASAKRSVSLQWLNRSGRSSWRSRTTRLIWRRHLVRRFQT